MANTDADNSIGHFMVAAGAIIELKETGKILVIQRHTNNSHQSGEWEIIYGRIAQGEDVEMGLRREVKEETGITDLEIIELNRVWHIYRGEEKPENEVIGLTYVVRTNQENIHISEEHQGFRWVTPQEALELIKVPGICKDVEVYIERANQK